ncbi:glycosyltransferase [Seonamhaeicola maritimus]|uniref:Glycosyltransferase n=1 Tax=Seonamhaeicola maritimus TaxID=2591822 RepID=A0A5C7GL50_9FLAO|nr:glycosyltransferase [Seonamhaeicola maritimus]TXG38857.1 glycosyltransferase [Seonamhaeicola maritimus]
MKVSVLMITYNHQAYVKKAVQGVLSQKTNFDFELIISNDCSTDNSHEVINQVIQAYDGNVKIKYFNQEQNLGIHKNFRYVHSMANGEYMAICEGDDYWVDDYKLQKQIDFLDGHEEYSLCYTRFKTLNQVTKEFVLDYNAKYFTNKEPSIDFNFQIFQKGWHLGNQTLVFRNRYFDYSVYMRYEYIKDTHVITHLLNNGKGKCLNFVSAVYRIHDKGIYSAQTEYQGYFIGYRTHQEIYLNNKTNRFLKQRHLMSLQNFINVNLKKGYYLRAFCLSFKLFFRSPKFLTLLRNLMRIIKRILRV